MKYKKKPIVIEAFQWTAGPDQTEDPEWIVEAIRQGTVTVANSGSENVSLQIKTLEGVMTASVDDWIIQGIHGEIYPCKPDIFTASYEPAESSPPTEKGP